MSGVYVQLRLCPKDAPTRDVGIFLPVVPRYDELIDYDGETWFVRYVHHNVGEIPQALQDDSGSVALTMVIAWSLDRRKP